jgi:hypothetical protein
VKFLAVGIDPTENAAVLQRYQQQQGYPWPAAVGNREIIEAYRVISTSIKYGIDRDGVVVYQRGYGTPPESEWRALLERLAAA